MTGHGWCSSTISQEVGSDGGMKGWGRKTEVSREPRSKKYSKPKTKNKISLQVTVITTTPEEGSKATLSPKNVSAAPTHQPQFFPGCRRCWWNLPFRTSCKDRTLEEGAGRGWFGGRSLYTWYPLPLGDLHFDSLFQVKPRTREITSVRVFIGTVSWNTTFDFWKEPIPWPFLILLFKKHKWNILKKLLLRFPYRVVAGSVHIVYPSHCHLLFHRQA